MCRINVDMTGSATWSLNFCCVTKFGEVEWQKLDGWIDWVRVDALLYKVDVRKEVEVNLLSTYMVLLIRVLADYKKDISLIQIAVC